MKDHFSEHMDRTGNRIQNIDKAYPCRHSLERVDDRSGEHPDLEEKWQGKPDVAEPHVHRAKKEGDRSCKRGQYRKNWDHIQEVPGGRNSIMSEHARQDD